jgi:hypothetical protein
MAVKVVNAIPANGGTLTSAGAGIVRATGNFDESVTLNATLELGTTKWISNQEGTGFVLIPPNMTVAWSITFGPPGGAPVPGGLSNCKLTVCGANAGGTGSSTILVSTPRAGPNGHDGVDGAKGEEEHHNGSPDGEEAKSHGKTSKKHASSS